MGRERTRAVDEPDEAACYELLRQARWPEGVRCPGRGHAHVTIHSRLPGTPRRRYLCLDCRSTFTDFTGTPFAGTNLPLGTWLRCLGFIGRGLSTSELAQAVGVKWDTMSRMRARLTRALAQSAALRDIQERVRAEPRWVAGVTEPWRS